MAKYSPRRGNPTGKLPEWEAVGPRQLEATKAVREYAVVIVTGPAGTGKTMSSLFTGLQMFDEKLFEKIVVTRPLVGVGEKIAAVPGDIDDKIAPYYSTIDEFLQSHPKYMEWTRQYDQDEMKPKAREFEAVPLELMRGRTFNQSFILIDEAQNSTKKQIIMALTRLGKESTLVLNGDLDQCDLKLPLENGLAYAIRVLTKHPLTRDRVKHVQFAVEDVQRHDLVGAMIRAFAEEK